MGRLALGFAAAASLVCGGARAETDQDRALAADFFSKGVRLRESGGCDEKPRDVEVCKEARENFRRAYALSPSALGALRNMAYVEKGLGLVASSARHWRELARKAPSDPQPERQLWAKFAVREAEALEPRVPHLTVRVAKEHPPDLRVTLDGAPLPEAAWSAGLDVDPGEHVVHAESRDRVAFTASVVVAEREQRTIEVELHAAPPPEAPSPPLPSSIAAPVPAPHPEATPRRDAEPVAAGSSHTVQFVLAGAGLATVIVGVAIGAAAKSQRDAHCNPTTKVCDDNAALDSARTLSKVSTLVTVVGGIALASGVVWYLAVPSPARSKGRGAWVTPYLDVTGAGLAARGRF